MFVAAVTPPVTGSAALVAAVLLGAVFGLLLHRGGVASYDVIVNQFRLRDFTVLKIMFTAIIVGGLGVLALHSAGLANYHIKATNLLGVVLGAAIFGVGMVLYGYCPGTALAAAASGSLHAAFHDQTGRCTEVLHHQKEQQHDKKQHQQAEDLHQARRDSASTAARA